MSTEHSGITVVEKNDGIEIQVGKLTIELKPKLLHTASEEFVKVEAKLAYRIYNQDDKKEEPLSDDHSKPSGSFESRFREWSPPK